MGTIAILVLVTTVWVPQRFVTDPLSAGDGALVCRITSEARGARRVRVEAIDRRGGTTFDSGVFTLAAGATFLAGAGLHAKRCRFSVEGEARGLRAHGLVVSADGRTRSLTPLASR